MSLSISKPVYDLVKRVLGPTAETWLDTERLGIGETPKIPTTAREVLQSGCPSCIATVENALLAIEKDPQ